MIGSHVLIYASKDVYIGVGTAIGSGVKIYTEVKDFSLLQPLGLSNEHFPEAITLTSPVSIGNYCGVGANSVLLPGAFMDDDSALGAMSLLMSRAKAGYLYYGTPAILRKKRS